MKVGQVAMYLEKENFRIPHHGVDVFLGYTNMAWCHPTKVVIHLTLLFSSALVSAGFVVFQYHLSKDCYVDFVWVTYCSMILMQSETIKCVISYYITEPGITLVHANSKTRVCNDM